VEFHTEVVEELSQLRGRGLEPGSCDRPHCLECRVVERAITGRFRHADVVHSAVGCNREVDARVEPGLGLRRPPLPHHCLQDLLSVRDEGVAERGLLASTPWTPSRESEAHQAGDET